MKRIGDQSDAIFLQSLIDEFGRSDIVPDDGRHQMNYIRASFNFLYPKVQPAGVCFVKDLQTAYWSEYGGDLR